jgi:hypothetical protein
MTKIIPAAVVAEEIAALEHKFPEWQVWMVPTARQGTFWCARRRDDHKVVLNSARSADELGRDIADWYGERAEDWAACGDTTHAESPPAGTAGDRIW